MTLRESAEKSSEGGTPPDCVDVESFYIFSTVYGLKEANDEVQNET